MYQKSPPFEFLIFCNKIYVDEAQTVPLLHFRHYATIAERKNIQKFRKIFLRFLSLRYSADCRRSRLVQLYQQLLRNSKVEFFQLLNLKQDFFSIQAVRAL